VDGTFLPWSVGNDERKDFYVRNTANGELSPNEFPTQGLVNYLKTPRPPMEAFKVAEDSREIRKFAEAGWVKQTGAPPEKRESLVLQISEAISAKYWINYGGGHRVRLTPNQKMVIQNFVRKWLHENVDGYQQLNKIQKGLQEMPHVQQVIVQQGLWARLENELQIGEKIKLQNNNQLIQIQPPVQGLDDNNQLAMMQLVPIQKPNGNNGNNGNDQLVPRSRPASRNQNLVHTNQGLAPNLGTQKATQFIGTSKSYYVDLIRHAESEWNVIMESGGMNKYVYGLRK
jgi:hypothetical protein